MTRAIKSARRRQRKATDVYQLLGAIASTIAILGAVWAAWKYLVPRPHLDVIDSHNLQLRLRPGASSATRQLLATVGFNVANDGTGNDAMTGALVTVSLPGNQSLRIGATDVECTVGDRSVTFPIPIDHDSAQRHFTCTASRPITDTERDVLSRGATEVRVDLQTTGRPLVLRYCIRRSAEFWRAFVGDSERAEVPRQFLDSSCEEAA